MVRKSNRLLVLSCCAPCSYEVLQELNQNFDTEVLFYNPNIYPKQEYEKRLDANKKVCKILNIPFTEIKDDYSSYLDQVKGLENQPEQGKRCDKCFFMRLQQAFDFAEKNNFNFIWSTLGVSRFKDENKVRLIAKNLETKQIKYLNFNWKEKQNPKTSMFIKENEIYCQNYCGCQFSRKEK